MRSHILVVLTTFLLVALVPGQGLAQKTLSGPIAVDTTLDTVGGRVYQVIGNVTVNNGVTLTIDPGVVLKFDIGRYLTVNGTLMAVGGPTAAEAIYFTSIRDDNAPAPLGEDTNLDGNATVPTNGDWYYIWFNDAASDLSTLEYCLIRYGGRSSRGNLVCQNASPNVIDCDLSAAYYGVECLGVSDPLLRRTAINAMTDVPIAIEIGCDPVFDNLVFESTSDNGFDAIGLLGGTLGGANTLRIRGATLGVSPIDNFVYILLADVTVANGGSLTIDPGIVVKPKAGVDIFVDGTLLMDGTADPDSQIVFTSFKDDNFGNPPDTNNDGSITSPAKRDWGVIEFHAGSMGSVSYATVRFGGKTNQGVLRTYNASPPFADLVVSDVDFGIEIGGVSTSSVTNCAVSNTTYTPFFQSVAADPTYSGNTFTNVGVSAIGLIGETIGVDSVVKVRTVAGFDNITYWLHANLMVAQNTNVRIEPGIVMKFNKPGTYPAILVDGSLTANAKPDSITYFTSQYDDDVGNPADTEGNGSATVPDDGQWGCIKFNPTAIDLECILDYCVFSYGGQSGVQSYNGAVWCNSSSPTITNCQFLTNETGIRTDGNAAPLIQDNNFFNDAEIPLATSVVANPQYVGNTFNQNNYHAVGILSETLAQNATLERIEVGGPPQFPEFFPYLHLGTLTIGAGVTLTVQPDIVVKVLTGGIPIDCNGGLAMVGKVDSLIVYTSIQDDSFGGDSNVDGSATSPASGNWNKIRFNATTLDGASVLEHCLFRFGSSGNTGVVELQSASPTIRDCEFEINRYGLWIQNASDPTVQDNLFRLIDVAPISKSILAVPTFSGNVYDNNAFDVLGLIGEDIGQDLTLSQWTVAGYANITRALVGGNLDVNFGSKLTIVPGVVLKMGTVSQGPFYSLIEVSGAIEAQGAAVAPVVFTSIRDDDYGNPADSNNDGSLTQPSRYDWRHVAFYDVSDDANCIMNWCVFRYGGYNDYGVRTVTASPTLNDCVFDTNNNYGLQIEGDSDPTITNCTFRNHQRTPIHMSLISNPVFSGNVFETNNGYHALGIIGETLAADVTWPTRSMAQTKNIPYVLTGSLTAGLSSILTIEPGVVIKLLNTAVKITVRRGLIAEGTADPESLIVFTSTADDFYGGDTNNDGGATDGSSARWAWIDIANEAIDASTRFDYCVFRYSYNSASYGALNVTNANPQVSHSIFNNNGVGINYIGASGDPTKGQVNDCDIFGNTYYGIKNTGMSFTVNAQNNWWGDATGPYDPSDDTGSGGFYNPGGLGDPVTDMVDYTGWKTTGVQNVLLGDVSLNGDIRAYDSSLILQDLALLITLSPLQALVADVDCSGIYSTLDASLILQYVAGLISYFPCAYESVPTKQRIMITEDYPGSEPGDFRVRLPEFEVTASEVVEVPIEVSGSGELLGHEYRVRFDSEQVTIEDVRLTAASSGATMFWNVVDGELAIALASPELLPVEAAVELVVRGADTLEGSETADLVLTRARLNEQDVISPSGGDTPVRSALRLEQNNPNPFNPSTKIAYSVPGVLGNEVYVTLVVYDLRGREVRRLVDEPQGSGERQVVWDGRDFAGRAMASGVYIYQLKAGDESATQKMLLLK